MTRKGGNMFTYTTKGVCSRQISFEIVNNVIKNVNFKGGCSGNLQGIGKLVEGMDALEALRRLRGIKCGDKETSCPDQLSRAIEQCLNEK